MSTTATQLQPSSGTGTPSPLRRFRSRIVGAIAALLLAITGTGILAAPTAHAAQSGVVSTCFKFMYGGATGAWAKTTYIDVLSANGGWYELTSFVPSVYTGCMYEWVPAGYTFRFRVSTRPYGATGPYCSATSRGVYIVPNRVNSLATIWVVCK